MENQKRKMAVFYRALQESHREMIRRSTDRYGFQVVFCEDAESAVQEAADAEIVFSLDSSLAKAGKTIKWVCTPSAGVDHFVREVAGTEIMLSNSSGAYGVTIAEHIIMVTLELMRNRPAYIDLARQRIWQNDLPTRSIFGSRVVFLGTGDIGQEAAVRIRALQPKSIVGINRHGENPKGLFDEIRKLPEIDNVLPGTDVLIASLPSTAETRGLLTEERMRRLPETSYLVNVGRGDVLDQQALERILREGKLGGAALDVFEKEPLPEDSGLWDCPRLVLTTHVAGNWTLPYTVDRIVDLFLEDFENYCENRPLKRRVDPSVGY